MVNEKFNSINELYKRVSPALRSRVRELKKINLLLVSEKDIWRYLCEKKWKNENDLTLYDIVNDILYVSPEDLVNYLNEKRSL